MHLSLDQSALDQLRELDPDGSAGVLAQIINAYLDDAPALIAQMQAALGANDVRTLTRHVHSLKSTSLSLGATRVANLAREIEMAGKSNVLDSCPALLMALNAEYAAAQRLLKAALPVQP